MSILVSVLPICLLFGLMLRWKVAGWKSAVITLFVTLTLALLVSPLLGMIPERLCSESGLSIISWSFVEGSLKAIFPILLIIITAIYSYNVLVASESIEIIKQQLSSLSNDRGIIVLIMVWGFGGLLEGMAGFGTAVAIPAAILIGIGFHPLLAGLTALLGNTVATGFGAIGVPVTTLCNEISEGGITSSDTLHHVSSYVILQLSPLFILIPFAILMLVQRKKWIKNLVISVWVGGVSFLVQLACAFYLGVETPAIIGSIAALTSLLIYVRITERGQNYPEEKGRSFKTDNLKVSELPDSNISNHTVQSITIWKSIKAWSIYILILLLILLVSPLCPTVSRFLKTVIVTSFTLPVVGSRFSFSWFGNAAVMLFLGSILGGLIQGISLKKLLILFVQTIKNLRYTIITVISLITLASIMNYSGMISTLAGGLMTLSGRFYPLIAPLVGAIGTFVTGSDTSSNILFGKLQAHMATKLGMTGQSTIAGIGGTESEWLGAANTSGATAGKMISPQSIAIATGACDMKDSDDKLLRKALPYALGYIFIVGLIVYLGGRM